MSGTRRRSSVAATSQRRRASRRSSWHGSWVPSANHFDREESELRLRRRPAARIAASVGDDHDADEAHVVGAGEDEDLLSCEMRAAEGGGGPSVDAGDDGKGRYGALAGGGASPASSSVTSPPGDDTSPRKTSCSQLPMAALRTLPAAVLLAVLNLMMSVPFGSAYFSPVVPLGAAERQSLGMRLCLLSGAMGQFVIGGFGLSTLDPTVLMQLAELTPFYHKFADIASRRGDAGSNDADDSVVLPTTLYLMSLSTALAGVSIYVVGRLGLGKVTSFFPNYVILGLVGGCGVFFVAISVTTSVAIASSDDVSGEEEGTSSLVSSALTTNFALTVLFAAAIRPLRALIPKDRFALLDPVYFLSIPLIFYGGMYALGISFDDAVEGGYFFKEPGGGEGGASSKSTWEQVADIWAGFDAANVRWMAAFDAVPDFISSSVLSIVLTSPFPVLAAVFLGTEETFDISKNFVAHGYANVLIGAVIPGGLFMMESYSNVVIYKNSGGAGRIGNALLSILTFAVFVYGPRLVEIIPRCMAGALMLDLGFELFLEAVTDVSFTVTEYASIWLILVAMTAYNMTVGLFVGIILALFNFTFDAFVEQDPLRRAFDANGLPSSRIRGLDALEVLDDPNTGRKTIVVFQLQGHLFFGNMPRLQEEVFDYLDARRGGGDEVTFVIIDLDYVVGIDSSAASLMEKMTDRLKKQMNLPVVFVSGQSSGPKGGSTKIRTQAASERGSIRFLGGYSTVEQVAAIQRRSYQTLDDALAVCEDALIGRHKRGLEKKYSEQLSYTMLDHKEVNANLENSAVGHILSMYLHAEEDDPIISQISNACKRSTHSRGELLWNSGDRATSAKILVKGSFLAYSPDEHMSSGNIEPGTVVGMRCLLLSQKHAVTIRCEEDGCIVYSLDMEGYEDLAKRTRAARALDLALARHLSHWLQNVSNKSRDVLISA